MRMEGLSARRAQLTEELVRLRDAQRTAERRARRSVHAWRAHGVTIREQQVALLLYCMAGYHGHCSGKFLQAQARKRKRGGALWILLAGLRTPSSCSWTHLSRRLYV